MGKGGRRGTTRLPRGAVVRPVAMLVTGVAVGLLVWRVLTLEPPGVTHERISRDDRAALGRLLRGGPPRPTP